MSLFFEAQTPTFPLPFAKKVEESLSPFCEEKLIKCYKMAIKRQFHTYEFRDTKGIIATVLIP